MAVPDTLQLTTGYSYYDCFFQGNQLYDFTNEELVTAGTETRGNCDIPLTPIANTVDTNNQQLFACASPDGLPAGLWTRITFRRIAGTPALTDPAKWVEEGYDWDGTQVGSGTVRAQTTTTKYITYDHESPAGTLSDVLSVYLSDPTETYGLKRVDTDEVIIADNTPIPHRTDVTDSTGRYRIQATLQVGVQYTYWIERTTTAGTKRKQHFFTVDQSGVADWVYADQTDVEDLIGEDNLGIVFDLDDDGNVDTGAVQRSGEWSDGYINLKLQSASLTVPNALDDANITMMLKSASAHLAAWYGFHQRGLRDSATQNSTAISGLMEGYKKFADEMLDGVIGILQAEDDDDSTAPAGSFGFVPIVRDCVEATDEDSN